MTPSATSEPGSRLRIRHETTYRYAAAPAALAQLVRLTPSDGVGQRVIAWRVTNERGDAPLAFADGYGNACHLFTRQDQRSESRIVAEGEVETLGASSLGVNEPVRPRYFLRETRLSAPTPRLRALGDEARRTGGGNAQAELRVLARLVCERVAHLESRTSVGTPADVALAGGAGVCQDRAHVFLAAARALGYPARYVSGYWHGAAATDAGAMHAWAEAWTPDDEWIALDPSSGDIAAHAHVRVAVGLDYTEAAPIRGTRRGGAGELLAVRVSVDALRAEAAQQQ